MTVTRLISTVEGAPRVSIQRGRLLGTPEAVAGVVARATLDCVHLAYGGAAYRVRIEMTAAGFGGTRSWLVCPRCGHRRAWLVVLRGPPSCRECRGLKYSSTRERALARAQRACTKTAARLAWIGGRPPPIPWIRGAGSPVKRAWQRHPTHERNVATYLRAVQRVEEILVEDALRKFPQLATRGANCTRYGGRS